MIYLNIGYFIELGAAALLGYCISTIRHDMQDDRKKGIYKNWWNY